MILSVSNSFKADLPGLGRNRGYAGLSAKRVSKAVRQALRNQYGSPNVEVSCSIERIENGY